MKQKSPTKYIYHWNTESTKNSDIQIQQLDTWISSKVFAITVLASWARLALRLHVETQHIAVCATGTRLPVQTCACRTEVACRADDGWASQFTVVACWTVVAVHCVGVIHLEIFTHLGICHWGMDNTILLHLGAGLFSSLVIFLYWTAPWW